MTSKASGKPGLDCRYDLIILVQAKTPTPAHGGGGMRQHDIPGRIADGLAQTLRQHERCGDFPAPGQSQQGHGKEIEGITHQGNGPVALSLVSQVAREQAQTIPDELPQPGHSGYHGGASHLARPEKAL